MFLGSIFPECNHQYKHNYHDYHGIKEYCVSIDLVDGKKDHGSYWTKDSSDALHTPNPYGPIEGGIGFNHESIECNKGYAREEFKCC